MKLGIIGLGEMGEIILSGVLNSKVINGNDIIVYTHKMNNVDKFDVLKGTSENDIFEKSDIVLLAVKPQNFNEVKNNVTVKDKTIVSIAAGMKIETIKLMFNTEKVIRVMPNTPSKIGMGTSCIAKSDRVSDIEFNYIKKIFDSIGNTYEVEEEWIEKTIPLAGSMPAYIDYFMKAFIEQAESYGIDKEVAKNICCDGIIGSVNLYKQSDKSLDQLMNSVCSPGGSTIEGMKKLEEYKVDEYLKECYKACVDRSIALGKNK